MFVTRLGLLKLLLFSAAIFFAPVAQAANVALKWDPDTIVDTATAVAYRIYYRTDAEPYGTFTQVAAPATSVVITNLAGHGTYYFVATAISGAGDESDVSNEVFQVMNTPPVAIPFVATVAEDNSTPIVLRGSDVDGDVLAFSVASGPANGTLSGTPPNLIYTPKPNFFGTDQFTFTVSDGAENSSAAVTINVTPVNDVPTLNALGNVTFIQNASAQIVSLSGITSGATNEIQNLTVTVISSNPTLIPTPTVTYLSPNSTGALTLKPASNQWGTATITVSARDDGASNNVVSRAFSVFVNNPPTLNTPSNLNMSEDSGVRSVLLSGISSGGTNEAQILTVTATSSNPALIPTPTVIYASGASAGSLSLAPATNAFGSATITVTVKDDQAVNNFVSRSFIVTVDPVNDQPTLNSISSVTVARNSGTSTILLGGISSGANNEVQTLVVTAVSSNPILIPAPVVTYATPSSIGQVSFTPMLNQSGTATLTVSVNDGGLSNNIVSRSFTVTVLAPPVISNLTETSNDARNVSLAWNTDSASICYVQYGLTTILTSISAPTASGTSHAITLANLLPGTNYYLNVIAVSSGGSSMQSGVCQTEPSTTILWPAKTGQLAAPMTVTTNAAAESGAYISSASDLAGTAKYTLNIPRGMNYQTWARVKTPSGGGSLNLSIDGSAEAAVYASDNAFTNLWHWARLTNTASPMRAVILPMDVGSHELVLRTGTANTLLDEFVISNDPLWQPILPTTKPVLKAVRTSSATATLSWTDPSGNAAGVAIEYSADNAHFFPCPGASAPATTAVVGNLAAQACYFRIYSFNAFDRTDYSNVAMAPAM